MPTSPPPAAAPAARWKGSMILRMVSLLSASVSRPWRSFTGKNSVMDDWIDYYDSTHTIYVSKLHRDLHFRIIADDIISSITSPDAAVLDSSCGEALWAARVANPSARLILAEPAPGVRGRLTARFSGIPNITV